MALGSITDLWFRSELSLPQLAEVLGMEHTRRDAENHWEWVVGVIDQHLVNLTRCHRVAPGDTDTRIFGQAHLGPRLRKRSGSVSPPPGSRR